MAHSIRKHAPAAVGLIGAVITLPLHLILPHALSVQLAAVIVAVIGAIYVGFALQAGSLLDQITESLAASVFLAAALIELWVNPWTIPVGYVLHGFWDFAHHRRGHGLGPTPTWYPPFCAIYDWVFALGLTAIWLR